MLQYILELIYPTKCGICGKIWKEDLCKKCEIEIEKYKIETIRKCKNKYFDEIFHIFKYEGIIRNKILQYKFQNKAYLYKFFAQIILKNKKICGFFKKYDIIMPVPIHKKRKQKRGYNQTELIARQIAKSKDIAFLNNVLIKEKNIISQSELNKSQRQENIKGAFKLINAEKIQNKSIILLDDIYTTGSTVNECSKILKQSGAKKILIITIAKD